MCIIKVRSRMATGSDDIGVPVVLRVKRKRVEEPADALVVSKVARLDPLLSGSDAMTDQGIFRLVSTTQHHHQTQEEVLGQISKHRPHGHSRQILHNLKRFSNLTLTDAKEEEKQRRARKMALYSGRRYDFLSQLRQLGDESIKEDPEQKVNERVYLYDLEQDILKGDTPTTLSNDKGKSSNTKHGESDDSNTKHRGPGGSNIISNSKDTGDDSPSKSDNTSNIHSHSASTATITCNSTPMVREKVSSEEAASSDYVYDLYYTQSFNMRDILESNWIYAHPCEPELMHDSVGEGEEECYDDEEDSNDENNWRNDYPDEPNSDNESYNDESYEETQDHGYRFREAYFDEEGRSGDSDGDNGGDLDGSYWSRS